MFSLIQVKFPVAYARIQMKTSQIKNKINEQSKYFCTEHPAMQEIPNLNVLNDGS